MSRPLIPLPGQMTGNANCPAEVQAHFGLGPYRHVGMAVCHRVCAREMEPLGLTPDGIKLEGTDPCPTFCEEARVLYPPLGVIPPPEPRPVPSPEA